MIVVLRNYLLYGGPVNLVDTGQLQLISDYTNDNALDNNNNNNNPPMLLMKLVVL